MKNFLAFLALLFCAIFLPAQNTVTVKSSCIGFSSSVCSNPATLLQAGTISFAPVDANGNIISYQVGGGGVAVSWPVIFQITQGAFSGTIANTALTNPVNVCFSVVVKDANNNVLLGGPASPGYTCVQPTVSNFWCTAGVCNFDAYYPQANNLPLFALPPPSLLSLGGVFAQSCPTGLVAVGIGTNGSLTCSGHSDAFSSCALGAGGTCSHNFGAAYATAPPCTAIATTTGTITGTLKIATTVNGYTVSSTVPSDTAVINVGCPLLG